MQVSILVVADEVMLRETVLEMTRVCGLTAIGAENLAQASELLRNIAADFVVIIKIPFEDDWTSEVSHLRKIAPAIKVLLASTYLAEEWKDKALIDGHLRKPFTIADLKRIVHSLT